MKISFSSCFLLGLILLLPMGAAAQFQANINLSPAVSVAPTPTVVAPLKSHLAVETPLTPAEETPTTAVPAAPATGSGLGTAVAIPSLSSGNFNDNNVVAAIKPALFIGIDKNTTPGSGQSGLIYGLKSGPLISDYNLGTSLQTEARRLLLDPDISILINPYVGYYFDGSHSNYGIFFGSIDPSWVDLENFSTSATSGIFVLVERLGFHIVALNQIGFGSTIRFIQYNFEDSNFFNNTFGVNDPNSCDFSAKLEYMTSSNIILSVNYHRFLGDSIMNIANGPAITLESSTQFSLF